MYLVSEILLLKKLNQILPSNKYLYLFLLLVGISTIVRITIPRQSHYSKTTKQVTGILISNKLEEQKVTMMIRGKEKIKGVYYFKTKEENKKYQKEINLGDHVEIKGQLTTPREPTTKNLFNYKTYLQRKNIFYIMNIEKITKRKNNTSLYYKIKDEIEKRKMNPYIEAFLLGNQENIREEAKISYQENGISHLFAISGMQFYLLAKFLLKGLTKICKKEKTRYKIVFLILLGYLTLIEKTASIIRSVLFFFLFSINKVWNLSFKKTSLILLSLSITVLINPFYITEVAFWYSYVISIGFLLVLKGNTSYLKTLVKTSSLAFLLSIPISLYYWKEINVFSIIYNLFYIPFVNIVLFPASIITFLFPILEPIYNVLIKGLETSSIYLSNIQIGKIIFAKMPIIFYFIYLIIIFLVLKTNRKKWKIILTIGLVLHYTIPTYFQKDFIKIIDVGQGDSILIYSKGKTALVDTGGKPTYNTKEESSTITKYITIPLLKNLGIKKLDYIFLTHGDYDHMGEILYLKKHFKVENIYLNLGEEKRIEKEVRKEIKNVKKVNQEEIFPIGNFTIYQLNKEWKEENTSSSVYYVLHPNLNILLMGDATIETERYLQENYNLNADILKVGHHGSDTSTSLSFLKEVSPRLAIISVGEKNRYHHPKEEVIERLINQKIPYLTTITSGTITIFPKTEVIIEDKKER